MYVSIVYLLDQHKSAVDASTMQFYKLTEFQELTSSDALHNHIFPDSLIGVGVVENPPALHSIVNQHGIVPTAGIPIRSPRPDSPAT